MINYKESAKNLNNILATYKYISKTTLKEVISDTISKSYQKDFFKVMCEDGTAKLVGDMYEVKLPIYYKKIEFWHNRIKSKYKLYAANKLPKQKSVELYLKELSGEDFINLIGPICTSKKCKLQYIDSYNDEEILKLPDSIKKKIIHFKTY